jgi:hypothetical protein
MLYILLSSVYHLKLLVQKLFSSVVTRFGFACLSHQNNGSPAFLDWTILTNYLISEFCAGITQVTCNCWLRRKSDKWSIAVPSVHFINCRIRPHSLRSVCTRIADCAKSTPQWVFRWWRSRKGPRILFKPVGCSFFLYLPSFVKHSGFGVSIQ